MGKTHYKNKADGIWRTTLKIVLWPLHSHEHRHMCTHSQTHIQNLSSVKMFMITVLTESETQHQFPLSSSRRVEFCSTTALLWIQFITTCISPLSQTNTALVLWRVVAILRSSLCGKLCLGTFLVAWKCTRVQWAGAAHWIEFQIGHWQQAAISKWI